MNIYLAIMVMFAIIAISNIIILVYCNRKNTRDMIQFFQIANNYHPAPKSDGKQKKHVTLAEKQKIRMDNQRRE